MIRIVPRLCPARLASLVFLACPGRLRQIRLAIHAGLDGDPPIRIIDRRYNFNWNAANVTRRAYLDGGWVLGSGETVTVDAISGEFLSSGNYAD